MKNRIKNRVRKRKRTSSTDRSNKDTTSNTKSEVNNISERSNTSETTKPTNPVQNRSNIWSNNIVDNIRSIQTTYSSNTPPILPPVHPPTNLPAPVLPAHILSPAILASPTISSPNLSPPSISSHILPYPTLQHPTLPHSVAPFQPILCNYLNQTRITQTNQSQSSCKREQFFIDLLKYSPELMSSSGPFCSVNFLSLRWIHSGPAFQVYHMFYSIKRQPTYYENRPGGYAVWDKVDFPILGKINRIRISDHGSIGLFPIIQARYFTIILSRKLSISQIDLIENHSKFIGIDYIDEKEELILSAQSLNHCIALLAAIELFREDYTLEEGFLANSREQGINFIGCLTGLYNLINTELINKEHESYQTRKCFHDLSFPILEYLLIFTSQ